MSRGEQNDARKTFAVDSLTARNQGSQPPAPAPNHFALYFREGKFFALDSTGVERAVGLIEATPVSATAPGIKGQISFDASYLYVCVANNTWTRIALAW